MTTRTDIHRPSAIEPADYYFVALGYQKCEGLEDVYAIQQNQARLQAHIEQTGATFSRHEHGGNCHICGAHCIYTVVFHHVPTNTLIETGMDCAEKMDMGDADSFRTFRDQVQAAVKHRAGKMKAKQILADQNLNLAWELYELEEDPTDEPFRECKACQGLGCDHCNGQGGWQNAFWTTKHIVGKLVQYGDVSQKQMDYLRKLVDRVDRWQEIEAERKAKQEAERAAAEDCPEGRVKITGEVVSTRVQETRYGTQFKMLVKDDRGFKVWGTIPSALDMFYATTDSPIEQDEVDKLRDIHGEDVFEANDTWYIVLGTDGYLIRETRQRCLDKGDRVEFTAKVTPSGDDAKFGFYSRPTKAKLLSGKSDEQIAVGC